MNTKIIASLMTILVVAAAATAGTVAYFSDTEAVKDNKFTAGTLDLTVGDVDPIGMPINLIDKVPSDKGLAAKWSLKNIGSIDGFLTVSAGNVVNNENTRSEVEENAGDDSDGATTGELGALMKIAIWVDVDENGVWSTGDYYLSSTGTDTKGTKVFFAGGETIASGKILPNDAYALIDSYSGKIWADAQKIVAKSGDTAGKDGNFQVLYDWPTTYSDSMDNRAQSDSVKFDVNFKLAQIAEQPVSE